MRRLPPSVLVREELDRLLRGGVEPGSNIISELVDTVSRPVIQAAARGRGKVTFLDVIAHEDVLVLAARR